MSRNLNKSYFPRPIPLFYVLRNPLPPRRNGLTTKNSLCSLRLPPFLLSPLAHNAPQKAIAFSGTPLKLVGAPIGTRPLNLMECSGTQ